MQKSRCLPLFSVLLLASFSSADVTVGVDIRNVPPVIEGLDAIQYVILKSDGKGDNTVTEWCNVTVTDLNGFDDIEEINAVAWNSEKAEEDSADHVSTHYSADTGLVRPLNVTSRKIFYGFSIYPAASPGKWKCRVNVKDSRGVLRSESKEFTVYSNTCTNGVLDSGETLVDCGGQFCPACITVQSITAEVPAGLERSFQINIQSAAGEPVMVNAITKTDLTSDEHNLSSTVLSVIPPSKALDPYSHENAELVIRIPEDARNETYNTTLRIYTNSSISETSFVSVKVLPPIIGDLDASIEKTCLSEPVRILVRDSETGKVLKDVMLRLYYRGDAITDLKTNESGMANTMLYQGGTYIVSARRDEYPSIEKYFSILQCEVPGTCQDGIKNGNEAEVDCGGDCRPCYCFNGYQDKNELGIDCGGPCDLCPTHIVTPKLIVSVPREIFLGQDLDIDVTDKGGNKVESILKILMPSGSELQMRSNVDVKTVVKADLLGVWQVSAVRAGYKPAHTNITVVENKTDSDLKERIDMSVIKDYILPILLLIAIVFIVKRLRER